MQEHHVANRPSRVLVVANGFITGDVLRRAISAQTAGPRSEVLVVAPALNRRLRHWLSDEDDARRAAAERLERCLARLAADGVHATGRVGDCDPLLAITDALRCFPADALIVATHPEGRSNWLARHLTARVRAQFTQPLVHVVVDSNDEYIADVHGGRVEPRAWRPA